MKTLKSGLAILPFLAGAAVVSTSGCSTMKGSEQAQFKASGPTVMNPRSEPSTVELTHDLRPKQPAQIVADVKDFRSPVTDVKVRLKEAPIEVPMTNIGGTTYRAQLTPQQLQLLAVSGKTVTYTGDIVAKNQAGQSTTGDQPVTLKVKTPDLSQPSS